ncbi:Hint domain-containing protein [Actibacterium ureilyticum]|uniref:Hint domain-containing protein n=1 Tax=Actibacterium ureilyticum TaxID=1590614 RepID=UPI0015961E95|nr:Hint domain-containing protein [Actibacterium ureilyticum]
MTQNLQSVAGAAEGSGRIRDAFHDNSTMAGAVTPCFTPGTAIATPVGERPVEDLRPGDQVITRDNGIQTIRWTGRRDLAAEQLARAADLQPVLLRRGALGDGLPERDMMLSPNHRVLVANDRTALYFAEQEVFAAAKYLINHKGIEGAGPRPVRYVHFMCDRHEAVLSNGCWTESFQPSGAALQGMGNAQRTEILDLFPELRKASDDAAFPTARRALSEAEARALQR